MVKVPLYEQQVSQRPIFQQQLEANATAEAFGAGIGRGMQGLAQGLGQAGDAMFQLRALEDTLKAKDSLTAFEREKMQLDYGPNGYMTTQGRNAVDGLPNYNTALEELRKKHGANLSGGAAQKYSEASTAAVTQGMRSGIVHSAQGQKDWAASSSTARLELYQSQALTGYNKPAEINKSMALGNAEIDAQAELMGWGSDVVALKKQEFASTVHSNVAIALASQPNGARSALTYLKQNGETMDPKTRMDIEQKLKPYADQETAAGIVGEIVSGTRAQNSPSSDRGASGAPAAPTNVGGPRASKAFLSSISANASRAGDTSMLDNDFSDNLAALIQDAPPSIRAGLGLGSAYRSNERQVELFEASDKSGRMVAFPAGYVKPDGSVARGSNHLHGRAADLTYNGARLDKAPPEVRAWVHANAGSYGLRFPMSWESWHIEPMAGSSVVPSRDGVSARAVMPSYGDALAKINQIADPDVKASAIKQLNAQFEMRSKADNANADAAKTEIWTRVLQGEKMSAIPLDLKIAAGREAVTGFMDYEAKGGNVTTDPIAYSSLTKMFASSPQEFSKLDLTAPEIINSLSPSDWKSFADKQGTALTDERTAREEGLTLTAAFSQSSAQLEAVGITTSGKDGTDRQKAAEQIARFQAALAAEMEAFKQQSNKAPNQMEIQSMVNRLLLPIVVKEPSWSVNPMAGFSGTSDRETFLFDAEKIGSLGNGVTSELNFKYKDIPVSDRVTIEAHLKSELGRQPSEDQVVAVYEQYMLDRNKVPTR